MYTIVTNVDEGPLLSYIAPCKGDCSTAVKTNLLWTKIQEAGFQGEWTSDKMQKNGFKTEVTIPSSLKAGKVSDTVKKKPALKLTYEPAVRSET
jgi:hypothetical protein